MMRSLSHQHLLHHIAAPKQEGKPLKESSNPCPFLLERGVVYESIAMEVGLNVDSSPVSIDYCGLSEDTKRLVLAFYNSNEVSWQVPGRKDRVIIRETLADGSKYKWTEQL